MDRINLETIKMRAEQLLADMLPNSYHSPLFEDVHMARKVDLICASGLKFGATTVKPTMTPRWAARAIRSVNYVSRDR